MIRVNSNLPGSSNLADLERNTYSKMPISPNLVKTF